MSYNIIDENMLCDQMNNELIQPAKKIRDHSGSKNPHYNKPHRPEAKAAIAAKQRQRYEMLRQIVDNKTVTEARVREIVRETIKEYLAKNSVPAETNNNKPIDIRL